jgi:hypothetical protein
MSKLNKLPFDREPVATLKSDKVLATEMQELMEQVANKMNELASRGLLVSFNLDNGSNGTPARMIAFSVIKKITEIVPAIQDNRS